MRRLLAGLAGLACLALMGSALTVGANHTQTDSGKAIVFDHKAGNQYWVEVVLSGSGAAAVTKVDVMQDFNSAWKPLEKRSWGAWAASYEFWPGADVRFRATFNDGTQTVSCWFDHPAGTERCDGAPPPAGWKATKAFQSGPPGNSWAGFMLAAGDVNGDGRDELFVPSEDGLYVHARNSDGSWTTDLVLPQPRDNDGRAMATVGDVDGDGRLEAYSSGWNGNGRDLLYGHEWSGTGYQSSLLLQQGLLVQDLEVGDIKDTGDAALFVTAADGFSQKATFVLDRPVGGPYSAFTVSTQATGEFGIGDPERNGDRELWSEGNFDDTAGFRVLDHVAGNYVTFARGPDSPDLFRDMLVLDGDGDGQQEIYVLLTAGDQARIDRHSYSQGTWSTTSIPLPTHRGATALAFGDADLDGVGEVYAGDFDGRILQVRWTGTAWSVRHVATIGSGMGISGLLFADGDGDGTQGLYAYGAASTGFCCPPIEVWSVAFSGSNTPPGIFDASFTGVRGNEWWVQTNVATTGGTLSRVEVHINSGEWLPLTKQSWGGWAASHHIGESNLVQFRAVSTTGALDLSECYRWIPPPNTDAPKCGNDPPPAFDATFSGVKGTEWWVQSNVAGNQPIAKVEARVNCGATWQTLTLQSWGGWAKSFHVPSGAKVDFRATGSTGATDLSGGYMWPQATPTTACA